jgi:hypothetical protein
MGEVNVTIVLKPKQHEKGWGYNSWLIDFGKGQAPTAENVNIVCAESSQRYMSQEEAVEEAKSRVQVKVHRECGPEQPIRWSIKTDDDS